MQLSFQNCAAMGKTFCFNQLEMLPSVVKLLPVFPMRLDAEFQHQVALEIREGASPHLATFLSEFSSVCDLSDGVAMMAELQYNTN